MMTTDFRHWWASLGGSIEILDFLIVHLHKTTAPTH